VYSTTRKKTPQPPSPRFLESISVFLYYGDMISADEQLNIGVISDTHGKLPKGLADIFDGVDMIIHAGDIGDREILRKLRRIAPVHSVRGNMDSAYTADGSPEIEWIQAGQHLLYVIHDESEIDVDLVESGISAMICGHTHRAAVRRYKGVLYVNPGSAAHPRGGGPKSVALLHIQGKSVDAEIKSL
jgi:putative phosphoesterase